MVLFFVTFLSQDICYNDGEGDSMELLKVDNVVKKYGKDDHITVAVDHVSFSVEEGEFIAIVGTSGSGKSTLLHLLGGVEEVDEGSISIYGVDITKLNKDKLAIFRRRNIGIIYQFYNLIPILDVVENIELPLRLDHQKIPKKRIQELLTLLHLEDRANHLPHELSGGQQQRVSIARALITSPSLILADEPTGNLDSKATEDIVSLFQSLNTVYKQTIIMITHNLEIAKNASRVITIKDGKIIGDSKYDV